MKWHIVYFGDGGEPNVIFTSNSYRVVRLRFKEYRRIARSLYDIISDQALREYQWDF